MHKIPIYKAEREAGIADKVLTANCIPHLSLLTAAKPQSEKPKVVEQMIATNEGQVDLYYLDAILATIGWNRNDDVLDKKEVWIARATPEDKPFNIEHNPRQIRGHITGSYAITDDNVRIADDSPIEDLPSKYHLVASSVLYRFVKSMDEELQKEMEQTIAEIQEGKWFVSLEALFTDFDYAVVNQKTNEQKIIARTDASAFLTKYLRMYGGEGVYQDYRIGRLVKNITFSGKGLVKVPANPESVILASVNTFSASGYITMAASEEAPKRIEKTKELKVEISAELQARLSSLEASLKAATDRNSTLEKQLVDMGQEQVKAKLAGLEADLKARDESISALKAQVETEQKTRLAAEESVKTLTASLEETKKSLGEIKSEQLKANRVSQWVDRTGASLDDAKAKVEKFASLDDVTFAAVLETQPAKQAATQTDTTAKKAEEVKAEEVKNATADTPVDLATAGQQNNGVEVTRLAISKLIGSKRASKKNDEE